MNENITKRNELLAQKVIKGLESRNMTAYYAATKEEALKKAEAQRNKLKEASSSSFTSLILLKNGCSRDSFTVILLLGTNINIF